MQSKRVSILLAQFSSVFVRTGSLPARKYTPPPHLRLALTTTSFHQSHCRWGARLLGQYSQGSNHPRCLETPILREDPAPSSGRASHQRVFFTTGQTFGDPVAPRVVEVSLPGDLSGDGMGEAGEKLVLVRDDFKREFCVVAVKVPAKRTRCCIRINNVRSYLYNHQVTSHRQLLRR